MNASGQINARFQCFNLICIDAGIRKSHIPQLRIGHIAVNFNGSISAAAGFLRLAVLKTQKVDPVLRRLHLIVELLPHLFVGFVRGRVDQLHIGAGRRNGWIWNIGSPNGTVAFRAVVLTLNGQVRAGIGLGVL